MGDTNDHAVMRVEFEGDALTGPVDRDAVRSGLASEDFEVKTHAARVAAGLAETEPDRAVELVPALCEALEADSQVVVHRAAIALAALAADHPDHLEPAVGRLVALLAHDAADVRSLAARCLGLVALERPDTLVGHVEGLVAAAALEPEKAVDDRTIADAEYDDQAMTLFNLNREHLSDQVFARQVAANLLVEVAEHDPAVVKPHAPALVEALSTDDAAVLTALTDVIGSVADDDPAAVADAVDPLCDLLDHGDDELVASVVRTLGFVGDPAAVEPLRALATDPDRDDDLRAFADETADFLADAAAGQ